MPVRNAPPESRANRCRANRYANASIGIVSHEPLLLTGIMHEFESQKHVYSSENVITDQAINLKAKNMVVEKEAV
eukprot:4134289-Pleurochrysis_carterae.AAC.1